MTIGVHAIAIKPTPFTGVRRFHVLCRSNAMISRLPHRVFRAAHYALPGTRGFRAARSSYVSLTLGPRPGWTGAGRLACNPRLPAQWYATKAMSTKYNTAITSLARLRVIAATGSVQDTLLLRLLAVKPQNSNAGREAVEAIREAAHNQGEQSAFIVVLYRDSASHCAGGPCMCAAVGVASTFAFRVMVARDS